MSGVREMSERESLEKALSGHGMYHLSGKHLRAILDWHERNRDIKRVWCDHIGWSLNFGWVFDDEDGSVEDIDSWKFCPRCGAKRP
jgi:hypothetical protein